MKKYLPVFMFATILAAAAPAVGATNSGMGGASAANLSSMPAERSDPNNVNYTKYETRSTTRTYSNSGGYANNGNYTNRYYASQPTTNRSQMYRSYNGTSTERTSTTNRSQTVRKSMKRKYYLAHPFFQPTEGKFGSITDIGYNTASYNMDFIPSGGITDSKAKWSMDQIAIKEDLSFGITDKFGLLLMGRYDSTEYKWDWSDIATPDDKTKDNGLNIYGAGLQWRFTDNEKWIATLSGYYERQKDIANDFVLDLKAGYKVSKSTIYGLARGWWVMFDDEMYGNGIRSLNAEGDTRSLFVEYGDEEKTFFVEGGLGVFSVLDEDWTLNVEALVGNYDWHNQASIKGAIGWQPNDWFALNLYIKSAFYDSADGQKLRYWGTETVVDEHGDPILDANGNKIESELRYMGKTKIDKYREMSIGGQIIFYF